MCAAYEMIDNAYFPIVISASECRHCSLDQEDEHNCANLAAVNVKQRSPCNQKMSDIRHRTFLTLILFAAIRVCIVIVN